MIRILQVCEKNIVVSPPNVVALVANESKEVIPDQSQSNVASAPARGELSQRLIQAIGGDIYVTFGSTPASAEAFHCYVPNGVQRDISNDRRAVNCFTTGSGVRVATELRWRTQLPGTEVNQ